MTSEIGVALPRWLDAVATFDVQVGDRAGPANRLLTVEPGPCRVAVTASATTVPGLLAAGAMTVSVDVPDGAVCWIRPLGR